MEKITKSFQVNILTILGVLLHEFGKNTQTFLAKINKLLEIFPKVFEINTSKKLN